MAMYRIFASADGESHIEDLNLEDRPELGALTNLSEARVQEFDGSRNMDFHPLPERRLIVHLSGEVECGGHRHHRRPKTAVPCAGDVRLMEDVSGRGHSHVDLSPSAGSPSTYCLLTNPPADPTGTLAVSGGRRWSA